MGKKLNYIKNKNNLNKITDAPLSIGSLLLIKIL